MLNKLPTLKIGKFEIFKKGFRAYYLLVVSIIVLTIAIQTIIQYSLNRQRSTALVVNLAANQRTLSQRLLNEFYSCKFHNCDFAEMKLSLNKLYQMNQILQTGDEGLGIEAMDNKEILDNFTKLEPHLMWLYSKLGSFNNFEQVAFNDIRYRVDRFTEIMNTVVTQLQKKSEEDIRTMMIIEVELAIFSVFIVIFEIFFIVNPIINRIMGQKKKLAEIAWHQSHVFASHMKNIRDLQYVLKVEKVPERQREILGFISEELDQLNEVSSNMVRALEKNDKKQKPHHLLINKVEDLLQKYNLVPTNYISDDDKVHSAKL